jgi:hypothetical protein
MELGFQVAEDTAASETVVQDLDNGETEVRAMLIESTNVLALYLHMWASRKVVIGTDAQDFQLPIPAGTGNTYFMLLDGGYFQPGFSYAVTSDKGTTAGVGPVTPPTIYPVTRGGNMRALGTAIARSTDLDATGPAMSAVFSTRGTNLFTHDYPDETPRVVSASGVTIYAISIDNTRNPTDRSYLKIYNDATPTVGTDDPDIIVSAPGGYETILLIPKGIVLATACTYAVLSAGGTGGVAAPTETCPIQVAL